MTLIPETAPDYWIGFHPWAIVLYFSLWIYVCIPPGLVGNKRELFCYLGGATGLGIAGMLVFLFWPTATPVFPIDWAQYPSFDFLKNVDLARNAFPSLHAAFAVFSGLWLWQQLRELRATTTMRFINLLWCLGILYSTIATRQHVFLDILAGSVLGILAFVAHWQWVSRTVKSEAGQAAGTLHPDPS